jgi:PAS domain S-box-containing protein
MYFTVSPKGKIVSVNQFGAEYLGYRKKDMLGIYIWDIAPAENRASVKKRIKEIIQKLLPETELECRMVRKDGSIIWVHERTNLIIGGDGRSKELRITCRDITDSKHTREQLSKSLDENEILLKEIHHRVKNNMQVISSLLSLQVDRISDSHYISMFNESINRIQTMALIHELLYKSDNFTYIDFREYITRITGYLSNLYTPLGGDVDLIIDADTIHLELDTAIPCGLVINELVSNAFKYGLTEGRGGTINLAMKKSKDRWYELTVADDGPGMPESFDWKTTDTLGLKMVNLLVNHQIGGTIERIDGKGTMFRIRFMR